MTNTNPPKAADVLNLFIAHIAVASENRHDVSATEQAAHQLCEDVLGLIGQDEPQDDRDSTLFRNYFRAELRTAIREYFGEPS